MIFGAILAGGIGSRMKLGDLPKQFLMLGEKPIIIHTLEKFIICSEFEKIYIGVHPNWIHHMNDLVDEYIGIKDRICIVPGGLDRNSTIFNIVENIEKEYGESEEHIIVTHDSVRPFVTQRILNDNIKAALKYGACDTVVNATDTIVESIDGNTISNIPYRNHMYQGQTPQSFNISKLKKFYEDLTNEEKESFTDACKIFVNRGQIVTLVKGEVSNMKITTINDYQVIQAMIGVVNHD